MININKSSSYIRFTISSETSMVSKILEETQKFIGPFKLKDPFGLILIVRELLMNAVIHGNESIPERIIK